MDKDQKINSPRTLEACRITGVLPEELYFVDYKEYLSYHPEISNLPEDIKKYRFNLLEKLRQKTIKMPDSSLLIWYAERTHHIISSYHHAISQLWS